MKNKRTEEIMQLLETLKVEGITRDEIDTLIYSHSIGLLFDLEQEIARRGKGSVRIMGRIKNLKRKSLVKLDSDAVNSEMLKRYNEGENYTMIAKWHHEKTKHLTKNTRPISKSAISQRILNNRTTLTYGNKQ